MARSQPSSDPSQLRGAGAPAPPDVNRSVSPRAIPASASLEHPGLYFNRDLSWIDFNGRVLSQAGNESIPLLERVRFLAIAEANLDRFVQTRVGVLKGGMEAGVMELSPDGRSPGEQLRLLQRAVARMQRRMSGLWREELQPLLAAAGVDVLRYEELSAPERARVDQVFQDSVYPVLTPAVVDPGDPFPFISNLSLSLAVQTRPPGRDAWSFARVKVPGSLNRWVRVGDSGRRFLPLEALITRHLHMLFPGLDIRGGHLFRVTRGAEDARDEDEVEDDLVDLVSEELRERRYAPVVRLEVESAMPQEVLELLRDELKIGRDDVVESDGVLGGSDLAKLADLDTPTHRYPPWISQLPPVLRPGKAEERLDIFATVRAGDLLVHHPYESFGASVQQFLEAAAADARVLAIKQTLYRTSVDSPVVRALVRAADAGKEVAVLVEITASFDEQSNIDWADELERHGVRVSRGQSGLKTHAKAMLVVREEGDEIRTYCHIGTGNYHARTARLYTDLSLLTADPVIGRDLADLFHNITGHAPVGEYERLIVAPGRMRSRFEELIEREIRHQEDGRGGRIVAKMNALDDPGIIRQLYRASRAGVSIDLIVRGHCRLRPGLPGFSDRIRVSSIVGRFLEHDRIYRFENAGSPELFLGSADWRRRNMDERIEVIVPVTSRAGVDRLCSILDAALEDNTTAWDLDADGHYTLRRPGEGEEPRSFQETLMARASASRPGTTRPGPADQREPDA